MGQIAFERLTPRVEGTRVERTCPFLCFIRESPKLNPGELLDTSRPSCIKPYQVPVDRVRASWPHPHIDNLYERCYKFI